MNGNLLNVVKEMVGRYGESVLSEPRRVAALFADLAKDEPKPRKNAFVKCLEHGFAQMLKTVPEQERALCKQRLAQKLHEEEGLDLGLCGDSIGILAAVLFGDEQEKTYCANCGKELQEGWKTCPYCMKPAPAAAVNQNICETLYYISYNYQESGPYDISAINKMIASRQITADYWVRPDNSSNWERITALFNFSSILSSSSSSFGYGIPLIGQNDDEDEDDDFEDDYE